MYTRVVCIMVREYQSGVHPRCKALTFDSRGYKTGGCDVMGHIADAVREVLTLDERKRDDIRIIA